MTDWRLQGQERFLKGVSLAKQNYRRYREGWEHDHCEFCGAKFSERPEDLNVGYATTDCYHWICEDCYKDFKGQKGSGVFVGKIGSYKDSRPLCPDLHVPAGKRFDWPAHRRVGSRRGANLVLYRRRQMGRDQGPAVFFCGHGPCQQRLDDDKPESTIRLFASEPDGFPRVEHRGIDRDEERADWPNNLGG